MRYSQLLIPTVKETPADAVVVSHRLMMRAGMIRKLAAGVYTYLPLATRVFAKVSKRHPSPIALPRSQFRRALRRPPPSRISPFT